MEKALVDANLEKESVAYINLHGTSTVLNDKTETAAIKLFFGKRAFAIPTSSLKSMIGHPQGASGAAGAVASIMAINHGFIPPTINYENPDPECDLDYVPNQGRQAEINVAMCNSIGFGSKNSIIILKKYSE
jgi:3-oxoacyl-[acyl-carrier-protein] synthase II